jgi:CRISPR-associated protein Cas5d
LYAYQIYNHDAYLNKKMPRQADETAQKHIAIFERRASKGQCFHRPYLGCREFALEFNLIDNTTNLDLPIAQSCDFGFMLYDLNFENKCNPMYYHAIMNNGTIKVPDLNSSEVYR